LILTIGISVEVLTKGNQGRKNNNLHTGQNQRCVFGENGFHVWRDALGFVEEVVVGARMTHD